MRVLGEHFDVLVVGAGLSGIAAGYHLQSSLPEKTYAILEGREAIGGTWDLFRYPGIRSDSDMFTFAYSFRPWTEKKAIADGASILSYMKETAREFGIDRKIRFGHRVERAAWSSVKQRWTLDVRQSDSGKVVQLTCNFLFMCSGYYRYDEGYTPDFLGAERFGKHRIVHPQKWTDSVDYAAKRVVVIGSGATAVTLLPSLAKTAKSVTMLQRSPTYMISLPSVDPVAEVFRKLLPDTLSHGVNRWRMVMLNTAIFKYCRRFPDSAKKLFVGLVRREIGKKVDVDSHFSPRYSPWEQRLCVVPDADLFDAFRSGKADVITDEIDTFTETGIRLKSGRELEADLIVTATGLNVVLGGGIDTFVDEVLVERGKELNYKGAMLTGVPNYAMSLGYTNASFTLKAELICRYVCRVLAHMDAEGYGQATPRASDRSGVEIPILNLSSGYLRRAQGELPKQGEKAPWRSHENYILDYMALRYGRIEDGFLEFRQREGETVHRKFGRAEEMNLESSNPSDLPRFL